MDINGIILRVVAYGGHLETLKWARDNGCDWNETTCSYAIMCGNLETLKYAYENGCECNVLKLYRAAAQYGRLG